MTRRDALAALYRSRPNEWISVYELERCAGRFAWRSRSSECVTQLGMEIKEWCKRHPNGTKEPHRMYVPRPVSEAVQPPLWDDGVRLMAPRPEGALFDAARGSE